MKEQTKTHLASQFWICELARHLVSDPAITKDRKLAVYVERSASNPLGHVCRLFNARFNTSHHNNVFARLKSGERKVNAGLRRTASRAYPELEEIFKLGPSNTVLIASLNTQELEEAKWWICQEAKAIGASTTAEAQLWSKIFCDDPDSARHGRKMELFFDATANNSLPQRMLPIILNQQPELALNILSTAIALYKYASLNVFMVSTDHRTNTVRHHISIYPEAAFILKLLEDRAVLHALEKYQISAAKIISAISIADEVIEYLSLYGSLYPDRLTDAQYDEFVDELDYIDSDGPEDD